MDVGNLIQFVAIGIHSITKYRRTHRIRSAIEDIIHDLFVISIRVVQPEDKAFRSSYVIVHSPRIIFIITPQSTGES